MNSNNINLIRMARLRAKTALSRGSVYLQMKQGLLPTSLQIGEKSVAWIESEIDAVVMARIQRKSDADIRELVKKLEAARMNLAV